MKKKARKMVSYCDVKCEVSYKFLCSDYDDHGEEEQEGEESGEENDCVITSTSSNFGQSNFETSLDNSILLNSSVSDEDPVATFYNNNIPTVETFNQIKDEDKLKAFKDVLSGAPEDDYLTHLVFTILKLSSIGAQSPEAKTIAQQLYKEAFEYGKNKDRVSFKNIFASCNKFIKFSRRSKASETSSSYNSAS